jgi:antitoxin PrlF
MAKKSQSSCCAPSGESCCRVESLVSVDERGQLVLPKELREKAKIRAGDKFALISCESEGEVCCIAMVRSDQFAGKIKEFLGPLLKDIIG